MTETGRIPMRKAFGEHLVRIADEHLRMVVLDADVSCSTLTALFGKAYPDRFVNCGIAEANMVSVAAGMAAAGLQPVVSTFAFLLATRAADQIRSQIAYSSLPVVLAGGYAGLSDSADGGSHQSVMDVSVFAAMPNMTVICPGDASGVEQALEAALDHDGPVFLRLSRAEVDRLPVTAPFEIGKAIVRSEGSDVALISTGQILENAAQAAGLLQAQGIGARLIDLHTVKPLDEAALLVAARECGAVVTCEEGSVHGGMGSMVASFLSQHCPVPLCIIGLRDAFGQSGAYEALRDAYGLSAADIAQAARDVMDRK